MKKIILMLMVGFFIAACNNTGSGDQADADNTEQEAAIPGEIQIAVIDVTGLHCESCVNTVTEVLQGLEGINVAKVSLEYEQAKVKFEPAVISTEEIKSAIEEKGYGVGNIEVMEMKDQSKEGTE